MPDSDPVSGNRRDDRIKRKAGGNFPSSLPTFYTTSISEEEPQVVFDRPDSGDAELPGLDRQRGQLVNGHPAVQLFRRRVLNKRVDFRIVLKKRVRAFRVSEQSHQPIDNQLAQAPYVLVLGREDADCPPGCFLTLITEHFIF